MWYLLVAAGAGYFATKWQSSQKPRSPSAQDGQMSCPSSQPSTPKRETSSSQLQTCRTSPKVINDSTLDSHALGKKSSVNVSHPFSEKGNARTSPELKASKRTAREAFQVNPAPQHIERNDSLLFISKCSTVVAANVDNEGDVDNVEKLLKDDTSPSPSSCCSSTSTVINSPVDTSSVVPRDNAFFKAKGHECCSHACCSQQSWQHGVFHFQGMDHRNKLHEFPHHTSNLSRIASLEQETSRTLPLKRQDHEVGSSWSTTKPLDCDVVVSELRSTAATSPNYLKDCDSMTTLDSESNVSSSLSEKSQRDEPRVCHFPDKYTGTPLARFNAKQGMCQDAARKSGSTFCDLASERTSDKNDVDCDAFVSFGLAMAVCFMVSSSKKEMDKMGQVLRDTEDLVYDMRRELEERKLCSPLDEDENDQYFTIKPGDAICQPGCSVEPAVNHVDAFPNHDTILHKNESIWGGDLDLAAKMYNTEEIREGHTENVETKPKKIEKDAEKGGKTNQVPGNYCNIEEEGESEGGEDDFTMSMIELERKLWQVFQERQEERILELEAALEVALSKLQAKEEELQWWKDRAAWLMQQCFGTSDELQPQSQLQIVEGLDILKDEAVNFEPQLLSGETDLTAAERGMEGVDLKDFSLNFTGLANKCLARSGSTCSISSRESVLSINLRQCA